MYASAQNPFCKSNRTTWAFSSSVSVLSVPSSENAGTQFPLAIGGEGRARVGFWAGGLRFVRTPSNTRTPSDYPFRVFRLFRLPKPSQPQRTTRRFRPIPLRAPSPTTSDPKILLFLCAPAGPLPPGPAGASRATLTPNRTQTDRVWLAHPLH